MLKPGDSGGRRLLQSLAMGNSRLRFPRVPLSGRSRICLGWRAIAVSTVLVAGCSTARHAQDSIIVYLAVPNEGTRGWQRIPLDTPKSIVYIDVCSKRGGFVELLFDLREPSVGPDGTIVRSSIETWDTECAANIGGFLAASWHEGAMGQGKYLGTMDAALTTDDYESSPVVSTVCDFLARHPVSPAGCSSKQP